MNRCTALFGLILEVRSRSPHFYENLGFIREIYSTSRHVSDIPTFYTINSLDSTHPISRAFFHYIYQRSFGCTSRWKNHTSRSGIVRSSFCRCYTDLGSSSPPSTTLYLIATHHCAGDVGDVGCLTTWLPGYFRLLDEHLGRLEFYDSNIDTTCYSLMKVNDVVKDST